jgi:hypothetical protein
VIPFVEVEFLKVVEEEVRKIVKVEIGYFLPNLLEE